MQEAYRRCSCYPGYLRASNNSCQGESLSCFKDVLSDLGQFRNTGLEAPSLLLSGLTTEQLIPLGSWCNISKRNLSVHIIMG